MSETELRAIVAELREAAEEAKRKCARTKSDFYRGQSNAFESAAVAIERRMRKGGGK